MISDESKLKILSMSGRELFSYLLTREDLSIKQKTEINKFWLDQRNIKIEREPERPQYQPKYQPKLTNEYWHR